MHTRRGRLPGAVCAATLLLATPLLGSAFASQPSPDATAHDRPAWLRVFLTDGQVLTTLGEFTRVDDTVVLQVPVGAAAGTAIPDTRAVTLAATAIDWARTDAQRAALRRAQFERAGGARAYAAFIEDVAATLRDVALLRDPDARIQRLAAARARLAHWPSMHHGYRAEDVAETLSVVDDLLNGMRAAAGQQQFTLTIASSRAAVAPAMPAMPPQQAPSVQDVVAQALGLAPRLIDPAERLQLLQSAAALLSSAPDLDPRWSRNARKQVQRQIDDQQRVTRSYARLRTWALERTSRLLAAADVRGLMTLRTDVAERDARLARQRPAEVSALLATLDLRLASARRHRLRIERWSERRPVLERYAAVVGRHVGAPALTRALDAIKTLAGPDPRVLTQAEKELAGSRVEAGLVAVPEEARTLQQLWTSAQQLAGRALHGRRAAIRSGDMQQAWEASAAAAGALLLLQQVKTDVAALVQPPAVPTTGL